MATGSLLIHVEQQLPMTIVALAGPLTLTTAPQVRQALLQDLAECPDGIVIDLSGLRVDSDLPLAVFRAVQRHASTWPAIPVVLCSPPAGLSERLARIGMDRTLPVFASRAPALAAATRAPSIARADQQLFRSVGAPEQARDLIVEICQAWDVPELTDPARLVVSELVTNAVLHANGAPKLTVVLRRPYLHLVVRDETPEPPVRRDIPPMAGLTSALSGWGLNLVSITAHAWGHLTNDTGKVVWAMLRCRRADDASMRNLRPHAVRPQCLHPRRPGRRG